MAEKSGLFKNEKATREQRLASLLYSEDLSDCKFVVGTERKLIAAHKFLLAVLSPVFYVMFFGNLPETEVVEITDLTVQGFTGMLQYVYTGRIVFDSVQHAVDVLSTAKKYVLPLVETECLEYLKKSLTPINCLEILEAGNDLECALLQKYCVDFLSANTNEVLTSNNFLQARQSTVATIVQQNVLDSWSELELYKLIERWLLGECSRKGIAGKHGTFTAQFTVPCNFNNASAIYSQQGCTVDNLYWKAAIVRESPNCSFCIYHTTSTNKQNPKQVKLRVRDDKGGEVEVHNYKVWTKGWVDLYNSYCSQNNGYFHVRTSYTSLDKMKALTGTIKIDVRIKA